METVHQDKPVKQTWASYYFRRRMFFFAWLVWPFLWLVPAAIVASVLTELGLGGKDLFAIIMCGGWFSVFIGTSLAWALWPCPRCHKPIHVSGLFYGNAFSRYCIHCSARVGTELQANDQENVQMSPVGSAPAPPPK